MGNYVENYDLIVKKWEPVLVTPAEETKRGIYFLSNVDEDENLVRTIYCYHHKKTNDDDPSGVIKNALSKVLVHYHPLAGRLVTTTADEGRLAVDCTGEGVLFVEAEANCSMGSIDFSKPDAETRGKLVYEIPGVKSIFQIPPLMIQVTKFKCGGFVLGISFNHVLADGQAAAEFIVSWAETARGLPISVPPFLDRTILKARTPPKIEFHHSEFDPIEDKSSAVNDFSNEEIMVYKYLKFTPQMIQTAKSKTTGLLTKPCSSYEALSAFVWRARTRALNTAPDQLTRILLVVNTRGRFEPPLPKGYFGNAIKFTPAHSLARDLVDQPLSYVVGLVQEAIRRVNDEHLRSTIDYNEIRRAIRPLGFTYISSTWSGLAFGSTNFGWGEAISTGPVELPVDEGILFLPRQEKGKMCMYAFMGLPVSAMGNFEELVRQIN
ncbi:unnamed protein product [Linum tenue]|uniref:Uncharacterized protein n=1 Tax=Linum tenue TaxID=586396 RepID=A0AAV0NHU3_9ROSI|nr:unnamed protein product [Linum tenue]